MKVMFVSLEAFKPPWLRNSSKKMLTFDGTMTKLFYFYFISV